MLDSLLDACVVISSDAYIEYFNAAAEKTFGFSRKEVDLSFSVIIACPTNN